MAGIRQAVLGDGLLDHLIDAAPDWLVEWTLAWLGVTPDDLLDLFDNAG